MYKILIERNKSNFEKLNCLIERGRGCTDVNSVSAFYYFDPSLKNNIVFLCS